MYLLVFVTLVISLIGIYAQALSLQTARLSANQVTVVQEMLRWHSTAIAQARYTGITPSPPTAAGCDFNTAGLAGTVCNAITGTVSVDSAVPPVWAGNICSGAQLPPCWTSLPPGYQTPPYTFYSIFYKPVGGTNYVITFVPPPIPGGNNPAPGFVVLPASGAANATQLGITMSDLLSQIKNDGLSPIAYGIVTNVNGACGAYCLVTPSITNGGITAPLQFPLPAVLNAAAYAGSVGIISTP